MSIKEIPKSFLYSCDVCNTEHLQENANGCYSNSTPPRPATDFVRIAFGLASASERVCRERQKDAGQDYRDRDPEGLSRGQPGEQRKSCALDVVVELNFHQ